MLGNVWEWVQDWGAYYPAGEATDPTGPDSGLYRVFRGGSSDSGAGSCRSASRYYDYPSHFYSDVGFRLARGGAWASSPEVVEDLPVPREEEWTRPVGEAGWFPPVTRGGPAIEAFSGLFVSHSQPTRVFLSKGPGDVEVRLRHQFERSAMIESVGSELYFGFEGSCTDPVTGFDHLVFHHDSGGTGGWRAKEVWSIDPETGIPYVEFPWFDHPGGQIVSKGTCLWRTVQSERRAFDSAMTELRLGDPADLGESEKLLARSVPAATVRNALVSLQDLSMVGMTGAHYEDDYSRRSWRVVRVEWITDGIQSKEGLVLVHDRRRGVWRTVYEFNDSELFSPIRRRRQDAG